MKNKLLDCIVDVALVLGICFLSYFDLYGSGWLIFIFILKNC